MNRGQRRQGDSTVEYVEFREAQRQTTTWSRCCQQRQQQQQQQQHNHMRRHHPYFSSKTTSIPRSRRRSSSNMNDVVSSPVAGSLSSRGGSRLTMRMLPCHNLDKEQQLDNHHHHRHRPRLQRLPPRGGGGSSDISLPDETSDGEGKSIMSKIRNVVRNILESSERKSPIMSNFLRSCFRTVEKLTGLKVLPRRSAASISASSTNKKKKKSKSKKKKKTDTAAAADDDEGNNDNEGEAAENEKSGSSTSKSKQKQSKPKPKPQAVTPTTKEHLTTTIKSTNSNHRIQRELKEFIKHPPDNLSVQVGKNIRVWIVTMKGAKGTIYDGETFKLRVSFPKDYPTVPPSVYFLKGHIPKHEHVYTNGDICLSLLGKDWRPIMTAQSIAVSILSILSSATKKTLPMDNAAHASAKPGEYQKDWVYHDDNC
jgi:ubiquitin-conjugating enzyme E2 W